MINLLRSDLPIALGRLKRGVVSGAPVAIAVRHGESEIQETEVLGRHVEMVAAVFTAGDRVRYAMQGGLTAELADTRDPYPEKYTVRRAYLLLRA